MSNINELVIKNSLRDMFSNGRVNICTVKDCLKLAGITPTGKTLDQLSALHCIAFKDMDRELAELVPGMVAELFQGMHLSVESMFKAPQRSAEVIDVTAIPHKSSVLRLLGLK